MLYYEGKRWSSILRPNKKPVAWCGGLQRAFALFPKNKRPPTQGRKPLFCRMRLVNPHRGQGLLAAATNKRIIEVIGYQARQYAHNEACNKVIKHRRPYFRLFPAAKAQRQAKYSTSAKQNKEAPEVLQHLRGKTENQDEVIFSNGH